MKKNKILRCLLCTVVLGTAVVLGACSNTPYSDASGLNSEVIKELKGIDLDGVGENDDKIVASYYAAEDKRNTSLSLYEFYLGNGKYASLKYDGYNKPDVIAANLQGDSKDEVVLILSAASSGYGSSDIHVMEVFGGKRENERPHFAELLTILDGSKDGRKQAIETYKNTFLMITNESGVLTSQAHPDMTDYCTGARIYESNDPEKNDQLMVYHRKNEDQKMGYTLLSNSGGKYTIEKQGFIKKE